jgi:hypothetical protein
MQAFACELRSWRSMRWAHWGPSERTGLEAPGRGLQGRARWLQTKRYRSKNGSWERSAPIGRPIRPPHDTAKPTAVPRRGPVSCRAAGADEPARRRGAVATMAWRTVHMADVRGPKGVRKGEVERAEFEIGGETEQTNKHRMVIITTTPQNACVRGRS